ncbi:MAG: hypothetical protein HC895_14470, partial [Leptolyngbyaceae cyanobacterium SM1_3_5]|nr:hypothetical protein [Leptolyngbyaceae cyanobacterium SM1_3_5]
MTPRWQFARWQLARSPHHPDRLPIAAPFVLAVSIALLVIGGLSGAPLGFQLALIAFGLATLLPWPIAAGGLVTIWLLDRPSSHEAAILGLVVLLGWGARQWLRWQEWQWASQGTIASLLGQEAAHPEQAIAQALLSLRDTTGADAA